MCLLDSSSLVGHKLQFLSPWCHGIAKKESERERERKREREKQQERKEEKKVRKREKEKEGGGRREKGRI